MFTDGTIGKAGIITWPPWDLAKICFLTDEQLSPTIFRTD